MIRVRCPHCQTLLSIGAESAGQTCLCMNCQKSMKVPTVAAPPTQRMEPAAAPMVVVVLPEQSREVTVVAPASAPPPPRLSFEEFWNRSKNVAIELEKLKAEPLPELAKDQVEPLPDDLPKGVSELGEPLAYLGRRGPIPLWRWIVFSVLILLILSILTGAIVLALIARRPAPVLLGGALGCLVGVVAAVSAIIPPRTSTSKYRFWICEHGMIWDDQGKVGCARWEDIHELYDDFKAGMTGGRYRARVTYKAVYRVLLDEKFVNIFVDPSWRDAMLYIWQQTSLARFRVALQLIYEGETAKFGVIKMDRRQIHAYERSFPWSKVDEVELVKGNGIGYIFGLEFKNKKSMAIDATGVSLPDTALAVCRVMLEETDKIGTDPVTLQEEDNPFAL